MKIICWTTTMNCKICFLTWFYFITSLFFSIDWIFLISRNFDLVENETTTKELEETSKGHFCAESLRLEVRLQHANKIIEKLQKRCSEKTKEISRLRIVVKQAESQNQSLKQILQKMRESKALSEEGFEILNVIINH